jgi:hypothetical protein
MLSLALLPLLLTLAPAYDSPAYPDAGDYLRILQRFPRYAERGWHQGYRGDARLGWFGDGHGDENGQRTLANFCLAYAWLATRPAYDPQVSGVDRATLAAHALAAIRYRLRTHVTGDLPCTDGKPWGDHWQSAWWVSRMMPAVQLLGDRLTAADRAAVERVVAHEADRHIGLAPRVGEYYDTKAEENAWDSEVMAWALTLYPNHPHAAGWQAGFDQLVLNTFSLATDAGDTSLVDGKPVNQWIGGPCVHPDFTIENHGPFHVCYMICPQHSLAWDWYAYRRAGRPAPAILEHHLAEVWARTKQLALWQGRFAYVGGKDWPRYAYGLYFVLPALVHEELLHGDGDARLLERQRVGAFEREQVRWNDGSVVGGRFTHDVMTGWPSEWETDCAANLTIAALLHELGPTPHPTSPEVLAAHNIGTLVSPYSELAWRRDPQRFVGWCWRSISDGPTGMICSDADEHLLEFNDSLVGAVTFADGIKPSLRVEGHAEAEFPGGFITAGLVSHGALAKRDTPYHALAVAEHLPCTTIVDPKHPLFTTPNAVAKLPDLTDLGSLAEAGRAWTPLVTDSKGRPSIFEAVVGRGRIIVSMTNLDQRAAGGDPAARALFANLLAYAGAPGRRCGYIGGERWLKQALEAAGLQPQELLGPRLGSGLGAALAGLDVLFIDRTATAVYPLYRQLLAFCGRGGVIVQSVLNFRSWPSDAISDQPPAAVQRLVAAALPDGRTMVVTGDWRADGSARIKSLDLLRWRIANDIFNDQRRLLTSADPDVPRLLLLGPDGPAPRLTALHSSWLAVDGDLGLAALTPGPGFEIVDTPKRQAPHGSLCLAEVRLPAAGPPAGYAVALRTHCPDPAAMELRDLAWTADGGQVTVRGADRRAYRVAARYGADGAITPSVEALE